MSLLARVLRRRVSTMVAASAVVQVTKLPAHENAADKSHHGKGRFVNPWPSFKEHGLSSVFSMMGEMAHGAKAPKDIDDKLPVRKPTWGDGASPDAIKATWLGHACFLLELPRETPEAARGVRVLFDPVFSHRCSPSQLVGPARFTKPPCKIEEIAELDAIVISHNHYDHLDTHTIKTLFSRARKPHIFAPLGNEAYFDSLHIPKEYVHTLDWWEAANLQTEHGTAAVHCLPAQHFTGRGVLDRFHTLWASWAVTTASKKVWFGGDTGYRSVAEGEDENAVPTCPAFRAIGDAFGGFDFAMIPIGAYLPRWFMSPIHCAPQDSVQVFQQIRARRAVGMHWGAWILTTEDVLEPPQRLKEECAKLGIEPGAFDACSAIGETVVV